MIGTGQHFRTQLFAHRTQRSLLFIAAAAALIGVAAHLSTPPAEDSRQAMTRASIAPLHVPAADGMSGSSACWITGDLVGDANPAVVAATACTPK